MVHKKHSNQKEHNKNYFMTDDSNIFEEKFDNPLFNYPNSFERLYNNQNSIQKSRIKSRLCTNCGVTSSPSWRRSPGGRDTLCNACGLYIKLHGRPRPLNIGKDFKSRYKRNYYNNSNILCLNCKKSIKNFSNNQSFCTECEGFNNLRYNYPKRYDVFDYGSSYYNNDVNLEYHPIVLPQSEDIDFYNKNQMTPQYFTNECEVTFSDEEEVKEL